MWGRILAVADGLRLNTCINFTWTKWQDGSLGIFFLAAVMLKSVKHRQTRESQHPGLKTTGDTAPSCVEEGTSQQHIDLSPDLSHKCVTPLSPIYGRPFTRAETRRHTETHRALSVAWRAPPKFCNYPLKRLRAHRDPRAVYLVGSSMLTLDSWLRNLANPLRPIFQSQ